MTYSALRIGELQRYPMCHPEFIPPPSSRRQLRRRLPSLAIVKVSLFIPFANEIATGVIIRTFI